MRITAYENMNQTGAQAAVTSSRNGDRNAIHTQLTDTDGNPLGTAISPMRTALVNAQGVATGSSTMPLYVSNPAEVDLMQGRAFIASTGKITTLQAQSVAVLFSNPATSGKAIVVSAITIMNDITQATWADMFVNPTTGLPTIRIHMTKNAVFTVANNNNGSVLEVRAATGTLGGVPISLQLAVQPSHREVFSQAPFVIHPGVSVGLNLNFKGAGSGEVSAYYREVAVA